VYDNSASFALSGSAVTMLGHSAGAVVVTAAGIAVLTIGAMLAVGERLRQRRGGS
jgi:hypothetical protein